MNEQFIKYFISSKMDIVLLEEYRDNVTELIEKCQNSLE